MDALVTWLVSAAVFAVPVLYLSMQGALRTFSIAVGVLMGGFLYALSGP